MTLQQIFISNLKKFRKERGISQMYLAELCNMGGNYIGQIEMGRRIPSFEKIEKIAAVLKIPPNRLFIDEIAGEEKAEKLNTKDYLLEIPPHVKKEISSRILSLTKAAIAASLDPKKY